jgi:hypothetical protein
MKKVAIVLPLLTFLVCKFYSCGNNPGALSDKNIKEGYELSKNIAQPVTSIRNLRCSIKYLDRYVLPKMACRL